MVNAFWLDRDLERAARWLVDRHVTSSVFECSMVLTTAVQLNDYPVAEDGDRHAADEDRYTAEADRRTAEADRHPTAEELYFTHADDPLTRWAASAHENWERLRAYTDAAHEEWRYRWDHGPDDRHGCWATVRRLDPAAVEALDWPDSGGSDPPQLTGDWTADDYVDAYRYYYANEKRHLFEWSKDRSEPPWVPEYTVEED